MNEWSTGPCKQEREHVAQLIFYQEDALQRLKVLFYEYDEKTTQKALAACVNMFPQN